MDISSSVVHTCDGGHKCIATTWMKKVPDCKLCKIIDHTKNVAGYIPRFESATYEVFATTFTATCAAGHRYSASSITMNTCEICRRVQKIEEESGFKVSATGTTGAKFALFMCENGHRFMAHSETVCCYACSSLAAITSRLGAGKITLVSRNVIFWGRSTYAKFACKSCDTEFYSCLHELRGSDAMKCPHIGSPVAATLKILEKYYRGSFDDGIMMSDESALTVSGFNSTSAVAVIHTSQYAISNLIEMAEKWCAASNILMLKVSATDDIGIKKTIAHQISAADSAPLEDVLDRLNFST